MARYLHTLLPGTWSASSSAPDHPAANLSLPRIGRPWRSASAASTTVTIDLGSAIAPAGIYIADWNSLASATLHSSPNNSTWTARGTITPQDGPAGRRNGLAMAGVVPWAAARYWRITLSGSRSDGLGYWRIGYVMVFGQALLVPTPRYAADLRIVTPAWPVQQLPNGQTVQARAGADYCELRLTWRQGAGRDIEALAQRAAGGPVLLDLDLADRTGWYWAVRHWEPQIERQLQGHQREMTTLTLREIV